MHAAWTWLKKILRLLSPMCAKPSPRGQYRCERWRWHSKLHHAWIRSSAHNYTDVEWDDHGNVDAW